MAETSRPQTIRIESGGKLLLEWKVPPRCPEDQHDWHYNQMLRVVVCQVCYRDYTGWLVDRVTVLEAQVAELRAAAAAAKREPAQD